MGGAKVGVDFAGDFYAGVAQDALGGELVYSQLEHEGGGPGMLPQKGRLHLS